MLGRITTLTRGTLQRQLNSRLVLVTPVQNSTARLSTSQHTLGFFDNLKQNLAEESEKDAKLKEARRKAAEATTKLSEDFNPILEKSKKISEDSMSELDKKLHAAKKLYEENEYRKKLATSEAAKKLKFKLPKMPANMNPKEWEQVKDTAAAAELIGSGIFGVMDVDPAYNRPKHGPRKRHPEWLSEDVVANEDDFGVKLHANSRWNTAVDGFKDSNMGQRMSNFQAKMEESDSTIVRGARMFMWKIKEGMQMNAETSYTVGVIQKMEKNWSQAEFCETLTQDFLPNILEASCQGEEDIIEDWCTEKAAGPLLMNKKLAAKEGLSYQRHIYALSNVEFMDASMDEASDMPTVMVSFNTQEVVALINAEGTVIDGSKDKPFANSHVFVFARDMEEMNPRAAWRVIECQSMAKEMSF